MTSSLLAAPRAQGVTLWRDGHQLRYRVAAGALSPTLRDLLATQKPALLAELNAEAQELRALVEKTGKQWLAFDGQAHAWDPERYTRSRDALSANLDRTAALLLARGETTADYGWHVDAAGRWSRLVGSDAPPAAPDLCLQRIRITMDRAARLLCPDAASLDADTLNADLLARWNAGMPDAWPELVPLERQLADAYTARDLPRLEALCATYLAACTGFSHPGRLTHTSTLNLEPHGD